MTYLRHPHLPDVRYPVPEDRVNAWLEAGWLPEEEPSDPTPSNDPEPSGEGHPNEEETPA